MIKQNSCIKNSGNGSFYGLFSSYEFPDRIFRCIEKANNISIYIEDVFLLSKLYPKAFLYVLVETKNIKVFTKLNRVNISKILVNLTTNEIENIKLQSCQFKNGRSIIAL